VLDEDFCCLLTIILASFELYVAHSLAYITLLASSDILKVIPLPTHHHPPIVEPPDTTIPELTLVKKTI